MPAKNKIKEYHENGYYHLYNRGVEKRVIFADKQDESVFLSYLKEYLSPKDPDKLLQIMDDATSTPQQKADAKKLIRMNNFSDQLDLLAYCLMPNHFHLLVKQTVSRTIEMFMRSLCTRYVQYFNHRNNHRVGPLFQDAYKAVLVESPEHLLHLSRYIHLNPHQKGQSLKECPQPSSYLNYLGVISQGWVKPQETLSYFAKSGTNSYSSFVENSQLDEPSLSQISQLTIDLEKDSP